MARGEVKWFNRKKGFGFIRPDVGSRDVFVHVSALHQSHISVLSEGQSVEFELTQLQDGRTAAAGIRVIEHAETASEDAEDQHDGAEPLTGQRG